MSKTSKTVGVIVVSNDISIFYLFYVVLCGTEIYFTFLIALHRISCTVLILHDLAVLYLTLLCTNPVALCQSRILDQDVGIRPLFRL